MQNKKHHIKAKIDIINKRDGRIEVEGVLAGSCNDNGDLEIKKDNQSLPVAPRKRPFEDCCVPVRSGSRACGFTTEFDDDIKNFTLSFFFNSCSKPSPIKVQPRKLTGMHNDLKKSYRLLGSKIITYSKNELLFEDATISNIFKKELSFCIELLSKKLIYPKVLFYRATHLALKPLQRSSTWLLLDREDAAGDNAEHLFRYLQKINPPKKTKIYFVISKNSPDYKRMKRYGKVLPLYSFRHKIRFMNSKFVISSHADPHVLIPFGETNKFINGLIDFDFIYLRHGVSDKNQSKFLNKYSKNIRLMISSSEKELGVALSDEYGYDKSNVAITGMPRHDKLKSKPDNKILIMPTWRKSIASPLSQNTGQRAYNESFKDSDFFHFYNSLLKNERLIQALNQNDYRLEFYLHPAFSAQISDFETISPLVYIMEPPYSYNKAFEKGSLLITDYSSVVYDFIFLKKPIIYTQFDREEFFKQQWQGSDFSYEEDGFGPVCYNSLDTVEMVIKYIELGCRTEEIYLDRAQHFFKYSDGKNSERVYNEIIKQL